MPALSLKRTKYENMPIDLIAFDLDGTTLNSNHEISERNSLALRKAHERGIKLVPCTGRSMYEFPKELSRFIDEFGFTIFPYIITENGAQVYDLLQRKLLYTKNIPKEMSLAILTEGRRQLALTYCSFGIHGAMDNQGLAWETEEAKPYIEDYKEKWDPPLANLAELIEWNEGVVKIVMSFLFEHDYEKLFKEFSSWPGLSLSSAWPKSIDFMDSGISKGNALVFVSQQSGIPIERTMAIGDNLNDVEMILLAGTGVAMENAIPELK